MYICKKNYEHLALITNLSLCILDHTPNKTNDLMGPNKYLTCIATNKNTVKMFQLLYPQIWIAIIKEEI